MTLLRCGFSLVVATRNRPIELRRLFNSLSRQSVKSFEVILVDQSDEPGRSENVALIHEFTQLFDVRYVASGHLGLSNARNVGLTLCGREFVGFPDDDCWYSSTLLERVREFFAQTHRYDFVSGSYAMPASDNPEFPKTSRDVDAGACLRRCSSVALFFRNTVFDGGVLQFDTNVGAGTALPAGEETDLVLRALGRGARGRYEPGLIVYHEVERPLTRQEEGGLLRERAFAYVMAKHALGGNAPIVVRLVYHLAKDTMKSLVSPKARARIKQQAIGMRLAWLSRRDGW